MKCRSQRERENKNLFQLPKMLFISFSFSVPDLLASSTESNGREKAGLLLFFLRLS